MANAQLHTAHARLWPSGRNLFGQVQQALSGAQIISLGEVFFTRAMPIFHDQDKALGLTELFFQQALGFGNSKFELLLIEAPQVL